MSKFMLCETEMADETCLKKALKDLGVKPEHIETHSSPVPLYGYQGDQREQHAHIVIRKKHVGKMSNDIGFERGPDGKFKAWVSDFDKSRGIGKQIMEGELVQAYSVHRTGLSELFGWQMISKEKMEGGQIRIRLRT